MCGLPSCTRSQQVVAGAREFEKLSPNTVKGYGALSTAGQNTTHHGATEASIAATKVSKMKVAVYATMKVAVYAAGLIIVSMMWALP